MNFYDLDPEAQQRAAEHRLLRYFRDYIAPYHPYLRKFYREQGIDPRQIRTIEDFRRLPIVEKKHLQAHPWMFVVRAAVPGTPPLPEGYDCEPLRRSTLLKYAVKAAWNIPRNPAYLVRKDSFRERMKRHGELEWLPIHTHFSTGSSGAPSPTVYTFADFREVITELASLAIHAKNPKPGYVPFHWNQPKMSLFPGAPHVAFYGPIITKMLIGSPSFETFGGNVIPTEKQIALFVSGGFETLLAIPSYLTYWFRKAIELQEQGRAGPLSKLKIVILAAEPVSEPLRTHLKELAVRAGASPEVRMIQTAGMTETKWGFHECAERSGIHLNPKYYYWEILDPKTKKPVGPREPGVLVFTHIGWRGTVLVRYWTGDLVKGGMVWDRCEACGWTFPRIYPPICRAVQDFTKVKGTRVDLSLLIETIRDTPGVRSFQVSLENDGGREFAPDQLIVSVVPESGCAESDLKSRVTTRVKHATEVSPDDVAFEYDEKAFEKRLFAKSGIKAEYVVEKRVGRE